MRTLPAPTLPAIGMHRGGPRDPLILPLLLHLPFRAGLRELLSGTEIVQYLLAMLAALTQGVGLVVVALLALAAMLLVYMVIDLQRDAARATH